MKDYKYVVFDEDITYPPTKNVRYCKGEFYEIIEIRTTWDDSIIVRTKCFEEWVKVNKNSKLFTENDIRRMKLEIIKQKI